MNRRMFPAVALACLLFLPLSLHAQIVKPYIGTWKGGKASLTAPMAKVKGMLERCLHDGSSLTSLKILASGSFYYMRGEGRTGGRPSIVVLELEEDSGRLYLMPQVPAMQCLADNCQRCDIRVNTDGRYLGCRCADKFASGNCHTVMRPEVAAEFMMTMTSPTERPPDAQNKSAGKQPKSTRKGKPTIPQKK